MTPAPTMAVAANTVFVILGGTLLHINRVAAPEYLLHSAERLDTEGA
ncbi:MULTISPECIES: hypothetical protein [unclassified Streptomyces]